MCLIVLHACVCVHSRANNVSRVGVQHTFMFAFEGHGKWMQTCTHFLSLSLTLTKAPTSNLEGG